MNKLYEWCRKWVQYTGTAHCFVPTVTLSSTVVRSFEVLWSYVICTDGGEGRRWRRVTPHDVIADAFNWDQRVRHSSYDESIEIYSRNITTYRLIANLLSRPDRIWLLLSQTIFVAWTTDYQWLFLVHNSSFSKSGRIMCRTAGAALWNRLCGDRIGDTGSGYRGYGYCPGDRLRRRTSCCVVDRSYGCRTVSSPGNITETFCSCAIVCDVNWRSISMSDPRRATHCRHAHSRRSIMSGMHAGE